MIAFSSPPPRARPLDLSNSTSLKKPNVRARMFPVSDKLSPKMNTSENVSAEEETESVKLSKHEHQTRFQRDSRCAVEERASWMWRMIRNPSQSVTRSASLEFTDMVTQVPVAGRPLQAGLTVSSHYELFIPEGIGEDASTQANNPKDRSIRRRRANERRVTPCRRVR